MPGLKGDFKAQVAAEILNCLNQGKNTWSLSHLINENRAVFFPQREAKKENSDFPAGNTAWSWQRSEAAERWFS